MAIVRWDPFRELEEMSDRLNRMIARPSTGTATGQGKEVMTVADWTPTVDISETESEYAIKAELPEVKKEDVKVTVGYRVRNGAEIKVVREHLKAYALSVLAG